MIKIREAPEKHDEKNAEKTDKMTQPPPYETPRGQKLEKDKIPKQMPLIEGERFKYQDK